MADTASKNSNQDQDQDQKLRDKLLAKIEKLDQETASNGSSSNGLDDRLAAIHSKMLKDNQSGLKGKGNIKMPQAELDKQPYTYRVVWNSKTVSTIKRLKSGQNYFVGLHTNKKGTQAFVGASEVAYLQDHKVIGK